MNTVSGHKQHEWRAYGQPAFVACVVVLLVCGAGMSMIVEGFGMYLQKEPLPLKKAFTDVNEARLLPYRVVSSYEIEDGDTLKSLGTRDYIQWTLENTEDPKNDPMKRVFVFITYYALPDKVPHVPEECYIGGGYELLATDQCPLTLLRQGQARPLAVHYLLFGKKGTQAWSSIARVPVIYVFNVNGEYAADRDEARVLLNKNLFGKSSYFSKVELVFNQGPESLSKRQVLLAAERCLAVLLPVLESDHWPAWPRP